ncbi:MAG: imidazole glycerol phosphate synthase subunit HisH [Flavobacteriales bacterium]|nr:imidazole glycerol phosphate synthase subunit HisH [Flavobacteriales bacterium]
MKIAVIDYGSGNVQSVLFALERIGAKGNLTADPELIQSADRVIFPGVGEASSAMEILKSRGLDQVIPSLKQPVLGICLGMQLLCESSEEGNTTCLGVFPHRVMRFPAAAEKVPHVGWNSISSYSDTLYAGLNEHEFVYYVHSYFAETGLCTSAITDYILPFSASLKRNNFHAVQFHPEKSGRAGERMLQNFLSIS